MLNTIKTVIGFIGASIEKYTPLKFSGDSIEGIYNYHPITENIATSGQPTEAQFNAIKMAGYKTIINLAPVSVLENSLRTERELLNELGLKYIHIPVDFKNPTSNDFGKFCDALTPRRDQKVWVHCAANMRVSAFIYRYRSVVLDEPEHSIKSDLEKIWTPVGVWNAFIRNKR